MTTRNYSRIRFFIIACLITSVLLTSCSLFKPAFKGALVEPAAAAPEISLKDQNGDLFQLSGLKGNVVLMFFGFTNCVDECPLTMAHVKLALDALDADANDVRVLLVSTDPVRDSPKALKDFLGKFDPSFIGVGGSLDDLTWVWSNYGIVVLDGGETHSSFMYVVDRKGDLRLRIDAEADPSDIASDLKRLLSE